MAFGSALSGLLTSNYSFVPCQFMKCRWLVEYDTMSQLKCCPFYCFAVDTNTQKLHLSDMNNGNKKKGKKKIGSLYL